MHLPDDIDLRLTVRPASAPLALDTLTGEEQARLDGFGSEKRRREFALGRATARALLADRLAVAAPDVPLRVAADGAPDLDDDPESDGALRVSIAHAATSEQTLAVAAVGERPLGVDLEPIRPRRPDLYRFLLHPEDYDVLDRLPHDHDAAQVLLWTLKEATLKAMRTGFRVSPKKLRLAVEPGRGTASVRVEGGGRWVLRFARRDGCFLAVAFADH
jgi:4'-phosphopantetheinyl transferase